jgi:hypothetical protein
MSTGIWRQSSDSVNAPDLNSPNDLYCLISAGSGVGRGSDGPLRLLGGHGGFGGVWAMSLQASAMILLFGRQHGSSSAPSYRQRSGQKSAKHYPTLVVTTSTVARSAA